jgi:hypothetical protein
MMELVECPESHNAKQCPICSQVLPVTEFGTCRARKDGHNLYCKSCIRQKVSESRRAQKAYRSVREQYVVSEQTQPEIALVSDASFADSDDEAHEFLRLTPAGRVREAIRKGARTQKEIASRTKLGKDEIGDALANLLLWTYEIRTRVVDNTRMYFINEPAAEPLIGQVQHKAPPLPGRKRDVPSSFSSLQLLMPGKHRRHAVEKANGWVAA